jgi:hypothetical protein
MASERLRLALAEASTQEQVAEVWHSEFLREQRLNNLGFSGDDDVCALGLEEQEDEFTMADAERRLALGLRDERHRYRGIPLSSATVAEARQARDADIDVMERKEWDDE